jgi:7-cyano-7-deazaguanine synthase
MKKRAVSLLSGGMDSAVATRIATDLGFDVIGISFDYNQRHVSEVKAASRVAEALGINRHIIVKVDMGHAKGSPLTWGSDVPTGRTLEQMSSSVAPTFLPGRNTIFLSYAMSVCEIEGATDIFIGANKLDQPGYPDCRPEYLRAFEQVASLANASQLRVAIHSPLLSMDKTEVIKAGKNLGVDFSMTVSCYNATGDGLACGQCDACILRREGFLGAGIQDETRYAC